MGALHILVHTDQLHICAVIGFSITEFHGSMRLLACRKELPGQLRNDRADVPAVLPPLSGDLHKSPVHPDDFPFFCQKGIWENQLFQQIFLNLSVMRGKGNQLRIKDRLVADIQNSGSDRINRHKNCHDHTCFMRNKINPYIHADQKQRQIQWPAYIEP